MKDSSHYKFVNCVQQLVSKITDIHTTYTKGMVNSTPLVFSTYYKTQLTLWFIKKWPEFKQSAHYLDLRYKQKCFNNISTVKIMAFSSDSSSFTKGDAFKEVVHNIPSCLEKMGEKELSRIFTKCLSDLVSYVDNNNTESQKYKDKVKKEQSIISTQNQTVEQVINDIIKSLPKERQHAIRTALQRSSNKLQDLQSML